MPNFGRGSRAASGEDAPLHSHGWEELQDDAHIVAISGMMTGRRCEACAPSLPHALRYSLSPPPSSSPPLLLPSALPHLFPCRKDAQLWGRSNEGCFDLIRWGGRPAAQLPGFVPPICPSHWRMPWVSKEHFGAGDLCLHFFSSLFFSLFLIFRHWFAHGSICFV
jgi:hypothetical protein